MPVESAQLIQSFLDTLKFEKRYSPHTIQAYGDDLRQFFDYILIQYGAIDLPSITSSIVRSWLASLKEDKLKAKSINRKISSLKSFFKHLMKTGLVDKSPMGQIVAPKMSKRL